MSLSSPVRTLPAGYELESDPERLGEFEGAALGIAQAGGVRLMRGRELAAVILREEQVVAGLWTEATHDTYTFDVAVAAGHQHRGLGLHLARLGQSYAAEMAEATGAALELSAISPGGAALAQKLGLIETSRHPGTVVFGTPPTEQDALNAAALALITSLPRVESGEACGGWTVRPQVDNTSSIRASLGTDYQVHGVREVPMSLLGPEPTPVERARLARDRRVASLAAQLKQSGELTPLIVVVNGWHPNQSGPAYVLEGAHRIDALDLLGCQSFPALIVQDTAPEHGVRDVSGRVLTPAERFAPPPAAGPRPALLLPRAMNTPSPCAEEDALLKNRLVMPDPVDAYLDAYANDAVTSLEVGRHSVRGVGPTFTTRDEAVKFARTVAGKAHGLLAKDPVEV